VLRCEARHRDTRAGVVCGWVFLHYSQEVQLFSTFQHFTCGVTLYRIMTSEDGWGDNAVGKFEGEIREICLHSRRLVEIPGPFADTTQLLPIISLMSLSVNVRVRPPKNTNS